MSNDFKIKYCPDCLGNNVTEKEFSGHYRIYKGIVVGGSLSCPSCKKTMTLMNLTAAEWYVITANSLDLDFIFALDKLKKEDPIEFELKIQQFIKINKERIASEKQAKDEKQNIPKCPTCGSTNIKKISGTKRFVSTGIFGLASSNIGKNMECRSCGAKW